MTDLERYIFRSHPGCCDKCDTMDNETRTSEPKYVGAHPNCKCPGWKKLILAKKNKKAR